MDILKSIGKCIMFLLSYSPILCFSRDDNFGSNEDGLTNFVDNIRFSLFSLYLGPNKYYFFTFKKNCRFKVIHKLNLENYYIIDEAEEDRLKLLQDEYLNNAEDISYDKEFLLYLITNQNDRKNSAFNKMNIYSTIVLTLIPLILIFFKLDAFFKAPLIIKISTFVLGYMLLNIIFFIFKYMKVHGFNREEYRNLKTSNKKEKTLIKSYYLDWKNLEKEASLAVAYIKNIEEYVKGTVYLIILIAVFNCISDFNNRKLLSQNNNQIIQIDIDNLEAKQIQDINYNNDELLIDKHFKFLYSYLTIYLKEENIQLVKDNCNDNEETIKVILME